MDPFLLDIFGNDAAGEWVDQLEDIHDLSLIHRTFERVVNYQAELEGQDAEKALAAADTLLRLKGVFLVKNSATELVDEWVSQHPLTVEKDIGELAQKAIARILTAPSELLELWQESDEFDQWKNSIEALERLFNS